jgi:Family of unknown function (DUF5832)
MSLRDPSLFAFNDEESRYIEQHVNDMIDELKDPIENLNKDKITVPNQNYALISMITESKSKKNCVKIRGVFERIEDAREHAHKIALSDTLCDIFVVSMYEWLLIPPDHDKINDQVYIDEQLNTLISEYRISQEKSKIEFEMRKDILKQNKHGKIDEEGIEEEKESSSSFL